MMMLDRLRPRTIELGLVLLLLGAGCASDSAGSSGAGGSTAGHGGSHGSAGAGGEGGASSGSGGSGGESGSGGSSAGTGGGGSSGGAAAGAGGAGDDAGEPATDAAATDATGGDDAAAADAAPAPDGSNNSGPLDWGGVGKLIPVPLQHTPSPVPPIIAPECPDDPTQGFTEYEDSFVVQRPYDLAAADRFSWKDGIYSFWVKSTDKTHATTSGTKPRTEARYSDMSTGEHIFTADVMFENPDKTCVFQIHNVNSPIAIYLRVIGDRMFNLSTGKTILTGYTGKWFNLKVAINHQTREVRTYVNNCLKETSQAPNTASVNKWYFKHGVYTCDSGTCTSHYKNIHLYQKGSTDKYNMMSTYP